MLDSERQEAAVKDELTKAVQQAFRGLFGQTVDTELTRGVRDSLEKVLAPIAARRKADWDRFVEWETTSTEKDVAQGRLNLRVKLLPGAPLHIQEVFDRMSKAAGPTQGGV